MESLRFDQIAAATALKISENKNEKTIDFLDINGKIVKIAYEIFHADKQNLGARFVNSFREFFWGKRIIEVKLSDEDSTSIFIKINDLSSIITPKMQEDLKKGKMKSSKLIDERKVREKQLMDVVEKIKQFATEKKESTPSQKVIISLVQEHGFSAFKEVETLIIQTEKANLQQLKESIQLLIDKQQYAFRHPLTVDTVLEKERFNALNYVESLIADEKEQLKQEFVESVKAGNVGITDQQIEKIIKEKGLIDAREEIEQLIKQEKVENSAGKKELEKSPQQNLQKTKEENAEKGLEELATGLGMKKDLESLKKLGKRENISFSTLMTILDELKDLKDKQIMLNTFVEISKEINKSTWFKNRIPYVKRKKDEKTNGRISHAFAIHKKDIMIIPNKGVIGSGNYKTVSEAIKLTNLEKPFVRLKIQEKATQTKDISQASEANKLEMELLEKLHGKGKEAHPCIIPPYEFSILLKKKEAAKLVMFQLKLDGDGNGLMKESAAIQLKVLTDVAAGLDHLHGLGYAHMDMKPANFMYLKAGEGKLGDFGMATKFNEPIRGGNLGCLPNEALVKPSFRGEYVRIQGDCKANPKIDSFGLGVSIFLILTQSEEVAFGLLSDEEIAQKIIQAKINLPEKDKKTRSQMLDVAQKLMLRDPEKRMSCKDAQIALSNIK